MRSGFISIVRAANWLKKSSLEELISDGGSTKQRGVNVAKIFFGNRTKEDYSNFDSEVGSGEDRREF